MEKLMWFGAGVIIVIVFGNFVPQTEEPSVQQVTQQATKQPTKQEQQEVVEAEDDDSEAAIAKPWEEAVRSAIEAAEIAQTAQSTDEWTQVESLWTQASELMAQVPESHAEFATAQQKITEYSQNAQIAEQKKAALSSEEVVTVE